MKGLFFTGTDTGIGKTWVTSIAARHLAAQSVAVGVYKPTASGIEDGRWADVVTLGEAVGGGFPDERICPQRFTAPLAPPEAARQENREVADSLNEIEDRLDLVRTEVEAAPAASSIVSQDGFPKQRIERMVRFEEEMMRSARNLTIRSQTVKSNLASEDIAELGMGLDNFQRTFSKRLGLLEGFKDL